MSRKYTNVSSGTNQSNKQTNTKNIINILESNIKIRSGIHSRVGRPRGRKGEYASFYIDQEDINFIDFYAAIFEGNKSQALRFILKTARNSPQFKHRQETLIIQTTKHVRAHIDALERSILDGRVKRWGIDLIEENFTKCSRYLVWVPDQLLRRRIVQCLKVLIPKDPNTTLERWIKPARK